MRRIALAGFLAVLLSVPALAGVVVSLRSGNSANGTLEPASEVETYLIEVPAGAFLKLKAKGAKKGPAVAVEIRDSTNAVVSPNLLIEKGTGISGKLPLELGGNYAIRVTSRDGTTPGDYSLKVSWKSPKKFPGDPAAADTGGTIQFRADAEALVAASIAPGKGSVVQPRILRIRGPNAFLLDLTTLAKGAKVKKIELPFTGDYELDYADDSNTGGDVKASVTVKQPKPSKAKINVTADAIGGGLSAAVAQVVNGADGGIIAITPSGPDDPLNAIFGTSINIPGGALPSSTPIVVGTSSDVPTNKVKGGGGSDFESNGPSVFFGPEGLKFKQPVSITIPADTSGDTSNTVILTKSANGKVTKIVDGVTVGAGSVTFPTSHFSSFQSFQETPEDPGGGGGGGGIGPISGTIDHYVGASEGVFSRQAASAPDGFRDGVGPTALAFTLGGPFNRGIIVTIWGPRGSPDVVTTAGGGSTLPPTTGDLLRFSSVGALVAAPGDQVMYADRGRVFILDENSPPNVDPFAGSDEFIDENDDLFDPSLGDGGPALDAQFYDVRGLAYLGNDLVIADQRRLRILQNGTVNEFAGDPELTRTEPPVELTGQELDGVALSDMAFNDIRTISAGPGNSVFVAERRRIRQIERDEGNGLNFTIAGLEDNSAGTGAYDNDGASLGETEFGFITDIEYDAARDILFVCDNFTTQIWALDLNGGICRLVAGTLGNGVAPLDGEALPGTLDSPQGIALIGGDLLITGSFNQIYRLEISIPPPEEGEEPR